MTLQHTRRIVKSLFILFIIVVCIYLLPRVAINAFYYPDNKVYGPTPAEAESITFTAKDGTHLHGWFIPTAFGRPENAVATVIHVHGNAGNMSAHWPLVSWLPERNVNLFMFDYRGFGESEGTPSQEGLLDDTKSAIDYVRHRADVNPERLVLLGQSLGGNNVLAAVGHCVGCANMRYADQAGIRAIILDSTFLSYSSIANQMINLNGVFIEIKERFGDRGDNGIRRHVRFLVPDEIAPAANPLINNVVSVGKTSAAKLCGRGKHAPFLV